MEDADTTAERPPLRFIDKFVRPEIPCLKLSKRDTVAVMMCIGFLISFGMRCNLGVAILEMLKVDPVTDRAEFAWDPKTRGIIQSSYFWGYLVTQIPGGFLAAKYRANLIFGTGIAVSAALNLIVPWFARAGVGSLIFIRVLQGLFEGTAYPASHAIWRWWAPPLERSKLVTIALCGSYGGVVIGMPVSAWLVQEFHWSAPFHFYGLVGIVWYLIWLWLVFEKPAKHTTISAEELENIQKSIGPVSSLPVTCKTTPWKDILLSRPVYAIVLASFCGSWTFYLMLLSQMIYLSKNFGAADSGILTALPHLLMTIIIPIGGIIADWLRRKKFLTTTTVRKLFHCGGFGVEAILLALIAFVKDNDTLTFLFVTLAAAVSGFAISGYCVNHLDIAPRYAGILLGISSTVGTVSGLLCPLLVEAMTRKNTEQEWENVYIIAAILHITGVIFYWKYASGELQLWAEPPNEQCNDGITTGTHEHEGENA